MTSRYPGGLVRKNAANTAITGASGVWDLGSQAQAVKNNTWPISGLALPVSGSLRFRGSVYPYLSRTPASAGNRQTWTFSAWIKRGNVGAEGTILSGGGTTGRLAVFFNSSGQLISDIGGTGTYDQSTAVFRDPSAWYHFVWVFDTTQATAANRSRMYVNGVEVSLTNTRTFSQNTNYEINNSTLQAIGVLSNSTTTYNLDGCMAEMNFIDGQALTPSYFGQTSAITGVWEPIKYTGTYGTNGYYLSLSDTSSIGKDFSGNGNNWTPNNFSTANDSTFDLMRDVPTQYTPQGATDVGGVVRGNYGTLSPLWKGSLQTLSNGNLTSSKSSGTNISDVWGTFGMTSGKWYFECSVAALAATVYIGIGQGGGTGEPTDDLATSPASYFYGSASGEKFYGNTGTAYGNTYTAGDVIGCAIDMDNGKIWWSKNGTWQASGDPAAGTNAAYTDLLTRGSNAFLAFSSTNSASNSNTLNWNFGQRPFTYTPPSGFKSLCTTNLPTPTIGATTATAANKYFDSVIWTGDQTNKQIPLNFTADFVWAKRRDNSDNHVLYDIIRGVNNGLNSNTTNPEATNDYGLDFDNGNYLDINGTKYFGGGGGSGITFVAWNWKANGTGVTNTAGSITSTVSANPTAGFSIVTWTGSGSTATIGHGLGVTPKMIIWMHRTNAGAYNHGVYHASLPSAAYALQLTLTLAQSSDNNWWNSTAPTSSVFTVGGYNISDTMVAYCFSEVPGYSAFGSYTGNGSSDGPFVYTGFKPKFLLIKRSDSAADWYLYDSARGPYNENKASLYPNSGDAEGSSLAGHDFLSNGFKVRTSINSQNTSGGTYIYMAFAEHPFKNSLAR